MARTILTATDANGKVVFRSVEPRIMSEEEIRQECDRWCVPYEQITTKYE